MGRKNKKYRKSLRVLAHERLEGMLHLGESKKQAIADGTEKEKIFSRVTYENYKKHIGYYLDWLEKTHPEASTLRAAKCHVNEWLKIRTDQGLSAWTVSLETAALCKLFQIDKDDPRRFTPPQRRRQDIRRSRGKAVRDKNFSVTNNAELINFCRGTGLRRGEMEKLTGSDFWTREAMEKERDRLSGLERDAISVDDARMLSILSDALTAFPDQDSFLYIRKSKGGRYRFSPIIGPDKAEILRRCRETEPAEKVWLYVSSNADIHGYRADYAGRMYRLYARDLKAIPYDRLNHGTGKLYQSGVYVCRKEEKGKRLDRMAMEKCSKALGHNRVDVVANSYLRGL